MKDYLEEAGNIHLSYYLEAADSLNIKYEVFVKKLMARFEYNDKHWFIINTVTPLINSPGKKISSEKDLSAMVLRKAGLPTPKQSTLLTVEASIGFYEEYGNIVIKPKKGIGGRGVGILPGSVEEVKKSFEIAQGENKDTPVLGEEYVKGDNFRLLTLHNKVIGVVKRHPPTIQGDGINTIQNLILKTNSRIPIDYETTKVIKKQGLTLESVPDKGKDIQVRNNTNLTTGGKTEEYSKHMHPYYEEIAVKAIKALGIKMGGVDLIAEDITKPGKCAINEINYNPGLRIHYQVDKGEKIKVAIPIMQYLRDNEI